VVIVAVVSVALWRAETVLPALAIVLALRFPWLALAVIGGWTIVERARSESGPSPDDEARLLDRLVAELEGGASPRSALVAIADAPGAIDLSEATRRAIVGRPPEEIAKSLAEVLPHNGRLVSAAWALAGVSGAPAAPVMRLLARGASERGRLERERRASTAQARATAWLIAGLPMLVLVVLALSGRIGGGTAAPVVAFGVGLQLAGLAIVVAMLRGTS
jgi:tight adherence protein B